MQGHFNILTVFYQLIFDDKRGFRICIVHVDKKTLYFYSSIAENKIIIIEGLKNFK